MRSGYASRMNQTRTPVTPRQYEVLADFRYQLRRFLRYSEQVARRHGVTPLQYQLMLQVKALGPKGPVTVGMLAERLQAHHHGVVALITRSEKRGFVKRCASDEDRREVHVTLTAKGERCLQSLASLHRAELLALRGRFVVPDFRDDEP